MQLRVIPLTVLQGAKSIDHIAQGFQKAMIHSLEAEVVHFYEQLTEMLDEQMKKRRL